MIPRAGLLSPGLAADGLLQPLPIACACQTRHPPPHILRHRREGIDRSLPEWPRGRPFCRNLAAAFARVHRAEVNSPRVSNDRALPPRRPGCQRKYPRVGAARRLRGWPGVASPDVPSTGYVARPKPAGACPGRRVGPSRRPTGLRDGGGAVRHGARGRRRRRGPGGRRSRPAAGRTPHA